MCFVVLSASGSGGFVGFVDFGPGFRAGVVVGAGAACVVVFDCFPRRHRVTGMNADVAEA